MSFQSGKGNVYTQMKRQLAELQAELNYERHEKPQLQEFARRMGESIMVLLAQKPYHQWPAEAKAAFEHEAKGTPTTARLYLQRKGEGAC